jgi:hypothetical protein
MSSLPRRWKVRTGIVLTLAAAALVVLKHQPPAAVPAPVAATTRLDAIAIPFPSLNEEMQIRPDLREALGKVAGITPQQRLDLLTAVRGTLSPIESNSLLHELLEPRPATVSEGWNSVYVQNICLILRDQPAARENFARVLATLARDPARDAVVRDYAVQHLRQVWEMAGEQPPLRASIEETFRELVKGPEPAMAATGLLSLHFLGTAQGEGAIPTNGQHPALPSGLTTARSTAAGSAPAYLIPDSGIQPLVDSFLQAPPSAANLTCRLTAIRIVSDRKLAASKPGLRQIATASTGEHALARMAAIAALGRFKDPADRPLLESLDRRDGRIAAAVKTALAAYN